MWLYTTVMARWIPPFGRRGLRDVGVLLDPLDPLYLGADKLTSNTGELSAIGAALRWLLTLLGRVRPFEVDTVRIVSDSQYALDAATCKWRSIMANAGLITRM